MAATVRIGWIIYFASAAVLAAVMVLGYFLLLQQVSPLARQRFVAIEVRDYPSNPYLLVTREFCISSTAAEAMGYHSMRRLPDQSELEEVYETPPVLTHLLDGCHVRSRRIDMPTGMRPGRYLYESALRWCNNLGRCQTDWLPAVTVVVGEADGRPTLSTD